MGGCRAGYARGGCGVIREKKAAHKAPPSLGRKRPRNRRENSSCNSMYSGVDVAVQGKFCSAASRRYVLHKFNKNNSLYVLSRRGFTTSAPPLKSKAGRRCEPSGRAWRGGREAEGGGLLNRYTGLTGIVGSNPISSASLVPENLRMLLSECSSATARLYFSCWLLCSLHHDMPGPSKGRHIVDLGRIAHLKRKIDRSFFDSVSFLSDCSDLPVQPFHLRAASAWRGG